jgi:hypothetical protein
MTHHSSLITYNPDNSLTAVGLNYRILRLVANPKENCENILKERSVKLINIRTACALAAFALVASSISCQPKPESGNSNANSAGTPAAAATTQPEAVKPAPAAGRSLATPTDTYKTGYAARQKKDLAGLKLVMSRNALEFLTMMGTEEKKSVDDQLKELAEQPQAATAETRNEKINGDRASLEYLNEKGGWSHMDFVKEGADWKIDLPKPPK